MATVSLGGDHREGASWVKCDGLTGVARLQGHRNDSTPFGVRGWGQGVDKPGCVRHHQTSHVEVKTPGGSHRS